MTTDLAPSLLPRTRTELYLAWVSFAFVLNADLARRNPDR